LTVALAFFSFYDENMEASGSDLQEVLLISLVQLEYEKGIPEILF
jgi:hypothetical protein